MAAATVGRRDLQQQQQQQPVSATGADQTGHRRIWRPSVPRRRRYSPAESPHQKRRRRRSTNRRDWSPTRRGVWSRTDVACWVDRSARPASARWILVCRRRGSGPAEADADRSTATCHRRRRWDSEAGIAPPFPRLPESDATTSATLARTPASRRPTATSTRAETRANRSSSSLSDASSDTDADQSASDSQCRARRNPSTCSPYHSRKLVDLRSDVYCIKKNSERCSDVFPPRWFSFTAKQADTSTIAIVCTQPLSAVWCDAQLLKECLTSAANETKTEIRLN